MKVKRRTRTCGFILGVGAATVLRRAGLPTATWDSLPVDAFVAICDVSDGGVLLGQVAVGEDGRSQLLRSTTE